MEQAQSIQPTKLFRLYTLETVVFICGAVVMILELTGSRILAPFMGTTIYVWTSLIGVILMSLSFGYWLGGKWADQKAEAKDLSLIIFLAAIFISITAFAKFPVLAWLQLMIPSLMLFALIGTAVLFAPASILLGMVSPYAVKFKMQTLDRSGRTAGNLYAISTVGSIVGTFASGFLLMSWLGNTNILFLLSILLIMSSILVYGSWMSHVKIFTAVFCIISIFGYHMLQGVFASQGIVDIDTPYQHLQVLTMQDENGRPSRHLLTDYRSSQSSIYLDGDDLYSAYTKFYNLAAFFHPEPKQALMIGGGTFTYPRYFVNRFPDTEMDVVEIDAELISIAKQYFGFQDHERIHIFTEDGRIFLNNNRKKYDMIFGDAYQSLTPPFQLTTQEAVQHIYDALEDDGVAVMNIAATLEGKNSKLIRAEYKTFSTVFPNVLLFAVKFPDQPERVQNILLIGLKNPDPPSLETDDPEFLYYLANQWTKPIQTDDVPLLTDEFAPIEQYSASMFLDLTGS